MVDLQKIETFLCAAEKLNISEAAKQLHLSQPSVSHQIKLLEQELGSKLFIIGNSPQVRIHHSKPQSQSILPRISLIHTDF